MPLTECPNCGGRGGWYDGDEGPVWRFAGGWRLGVPVVRPKMPQLPTNNPGMDIVIEDEE